TGRSARASARRSTGSRIRRRGNCASRSASGSKTRLQNYFRRAGPSGPAERDDLKVVPYEFNFATRSKNARNLEEARRQTKITVLRGSVAACHAFLILNSEFLIALLSVDLAHDAPSGLKGALHPSSPRRGVLAGEMDAAFGGGEDVEEADLPWRVQCEGAALPRIEAPAVRLAAFALGPQFRKDLRCLLARRRDAIRFG